MSATLSETVTSDPEPRPAGVDRYIDSVIDRSRHLDSDRPVEPWMSDSKSSVTLEPSRIRAELSAQAFLNYVNLSDRQLISLEDEAAIAMSRVDTAVPAYDMNPMMNNWPIIFDQKGTAIIGKRDDEKKEIIFTSDELTDQKQYQVLLGGLAAMLYHVDYPDTLKVVE